MSHRHTGLWNAKSRGYRLPGPPHGTVHKRNVPSRFRPRIPERRNRLRCQFASMDPALGVVSGTDYRDCPIWIAISMNREQFRCRASAEVHGERISADWSARLALRVGSTRIRCARCMAGTHGGRAPEGEPAVGESINHRGRVPVDASGDLSRSFTTNTWFQYTVSPIRKRRREGCQSTECGCARQSAPLGSLIHQSVPRSEQTTYTRDFSRNGQTRGRACSPFPRGVNPIVA